MAEAEAHSLTPGVQKGPTQAELVRQYLDRKGNIEREIQVLKDDLKELKEEFKGKIDLKALAKVERIKKITDSVDHADTFETYLEIVLDKAMARQISVL